MTKESIRIQFKQQRLSLSMSQRIKLDDQLLIQFQRLPLGNNVQTLLTFWPIEKHAEVDTNLFTRYLQHVVPNLEVAYPFIKIDTQEMLALRTNDDTDFIDNIFGIPEPEYVEDQIILPQDIDLIFVPLLAFDESGFRVGYGKGYYDRFLINCQPDVCKVGFSYFEAIDKIDDTHQYDVPLDYCITPERIYEF